MCKHIVVFLSAWFSNTQRFFCCSEVDANQCLIRFCSANLPDVGFDARFDLENINTFAHPFSPSLLLRRLNSLKHLNRLRFIKKPDTPQLKNEYKIAIAVVIINHRIQQSIKLFSSVFNILQVESKASVSRRLIALLTWLVFSVSEQKKTFLPVYLILFNSTWIQFSSICV